MSPVQRIRCNLLQRSPEQLEGKEADTRSDIFSLGAVLYEMVTGKRAFEGKTTASTIAAILAAEPKPLTAIQPLSPRGLEHLINTCMAKDPDERLQSTHDVKVQLQWIAHSAVHLARLLGKNITPLSQPQIRVTATVRQPLERLTHFRMKF